MQPRRGWVKAVWGAGLLLVVGAVPLAAEVPETAPPGQPRTGFGAPAALLQPCDQYNPASPAGNARIALDSGDLVDRRGREREMRSFIETGSIGKVDVAVVSATPPGAVRTVSAIPEISRPSRYFGERLKGIALDVALAPGGAPVRVVLDVRQVCARDFRNTFLYY
jgi:hypothetical protein